jgi:hypothetical protein
MIRDYEIKKYVKIAVNTLKCSSCNKKFLFFKLFLHKEILWN